MPFRKAHLRSLLFWLPGAFLFLGSAHCLAAESVESRCLSQPSFSPPEIFVVGEVDHGEPQCQDLRAELAEQAQSGRLCLATEIRPDAEGPLFPDRVQADGESFPGCVKGLESRLHALDTSYWAALSVPTTSANADRTRAIFQAIKLVADQVMTSPYLGAGLLREAFSLGASGSSAFSRDFHKAFTAKISGEKCRGSEVHCLASLLQDFLDRGKFASLSQAAKEKELETVFFELHNALVRDANRNSPAVGERKIPSANRFYDPPAKAAAEAAREQVEKQTAAELLGSDFGFGRLAALRSVEMAKNLRPLLCEAKDKSVPLVLMAGVVHLGHFRSLLPATNPRLVLPPVLSCAEASKKLEEKKLIHRAGEGVNSQPAEKGNGARVAPAD
jgi:hypothetical protein